MLEHTLNIDTPPQRVVVVGSHGFVGDALMRRLAAAGIAALGLGRAHIDLLADDAPGKLAALLRPSDALVAVAAIAPCKNSDMLVQNIVLARTLVKALAMVPLAHVVNISSDAVYGDSSAPMSEAAPMAPESLHGVMHLARELMFRSEVTAPMAMLRPTLIYGARDPHNGYGPNRFRRLADQGEPIVLFGNGEERRDHVYIDDVAELVLRTLLRRSCGSLNIATGEVHSFPDIAQMAIRLSSSRSALLTSPRNGPMPHNGYRAFDTTACRQAFPDFVCTPLLEGMKASITGT